MRVLLATLCLNEIEWIKHSYKQHKDWPGKMRWVFVEGADVQYAEANPGLVSGDGLSVDGTTEFLRELANNDPSVTYVPFGLMRNEDPAEGKVAARNRYLEIADQLRPDVVIVLDGDEFYTHEHQGLVNRYMHDERIDSYIFRRREIWRPPSIVNQPLFQYEIVGDFWDMACCHWWRYRPGMRHIHSHNTPEVDGRYMHRNCRRLTKATKAPQMIHLGFASQKEKRLAKNRYYVQRGEGQGDGRGWYVESRALFGTWNPEDGFELPYKARVQTYDGPIPECFQ